MRRKLIKIGNSTLLLSVPREWVISNNLSKGDEVEISPDQDKLTIWCDSRIMKEKLSMDFTDFKDVLARLIYAIYRSGVDQVQLRSKDPVLIDSIKSIIWKEAVGFEIMDQGDNSCTIVNVSGKTDDFQNMLRRLFLITLTMGQESQACLRKNSGIQNVLYLEQENNRLATILIRSLNKYGSFGFKKLGPVYYIIQELERIGDQYKFMSQYFVKRQKNNLGRVHIKLFDDSNLLFRKIYELFYNFEPKNVQEIRELRDTTVRGILDLFSKKPNEDELILLHHSLNIATRSFDLLNSIFILRMNETGK